MSFVFDFLLLLGSPNVLLPLMLLQPHAHPIPQKKLVSDPAEFNWQFRDYYEGVVIERPQTPNKSLSSNMSPTYIRWERLPPR